MLVTKQEAEIIVRDCELVKTSRSNGYSGTKYADIRAQGNGYTVTHAGIAKHYRYGKNVVSRRIYAGDYSIKDAVMTSQNCRQVKYNGTNITPTWKLELDTITGEYTFRRTDTYQPITLAGRTLTICWFGAKTNKFLRAKIRRKLREALQSGDAEEV